MRVIFSCVSDSAPDACHVRPCHTLPVPGSYSVLLLTSPGLLRLGKPGAMS